MSVHRTRVGRVHSELDSNLDACIQETIVHDGRYPTDVRRESRYRAMDPANRAGRSSASARTHTYSTRSTIQSKTDAVQPIGNPNERLGIADASRTMTRGAARRLAGVNAPERNQFLFTSRRTTAGAVPVTAVAGDSPCPKQARSITSATPS